MHHEYVKKRESMESSLEIYKITLSREYTFTQLVNEKWKNADEENLDDTAAFSRLYEKLLSKLIGNGVWESSKSVKKGLAVMNTNPNLEQGNGGINEVLKSHSAHNVIEGFIDAGIFNVKRKIATYTDTTTKEELPRVKIVTDSFYFYLYVKMSSNKAILMIEAKKGVNMSSVFTEFVTSLFQIKKVCRCTSEAFMPRSLRDAYMNNSVLKSVTCSSEMSSSVSLNGQTTDEQFKITVKVEPVSSHSMQNRASVISSIMNMAVNINGVTRILDVFGNKKGEMQNQDQKTTRTFELADPDVIPKLILPDDMYDEENSCLIREQIYARCNELLPNVKLEVYPIVQPNQPEGDAN